MMSEYMFEVQGKGLFPVDMLRRERCFPATTLDAHNIAPDYDTDMRLKRSVVLIRPARARYEMPDVERWESFGWTVTEIKWLTPTGAWEQVL
jgi:hypothetical protein